MNKQRSGKRSNVRFDRPWGNRRACPAAEGLYLPEMEHDACGVGMTCHIKGEKSHDIVEDAPQDPGQPLPPGRRRVR